MGGGQCDHSLPVRCITWTESLRVGAGQRTRVRDAPAELTSMISSQFALAFGFSAMVTSKQLVADFQTFSQAVHQYSPGALVIGIDASYEFPVLGELVPLMPDFMKDGGGKYVDIVTWHYYPYTSDRLIPADINLWDPTVEKLMSPECLDRMDHFAEEVAGLTKQYTNNAQVWLGEMGGSAGGGQANVTNVFADTFWFMSSLGTLAQHGQFVVCRQDLTGSGGYGLLELNDNLEPNPDYWASVLWKRLMGPTVLSTTQPNTDAVRIFAHCARNSSAGAVTLLVVNYGNENVTLKVPLTTLPRTEYVLSGNPHERNIYLGGQLLQAASDGQIPPLEGASGSSTDIVLAPQTIGFFVLSAANAGACV
eukprot:TRINITY_DN7384_c0_g2_i2.p1 TRINITY_DN7384_c0_g2~~TRINITY_DN7384_c0_g2_i2.p1  ORF type:complete len:365 (-),score=76.72 TRINITY_DN7384_c0_g2_i2:81-1175(-)